MKMNFNEDEVQNLNDDSCETMKAMNIEAETSGIGNIRKEVDLTNDESVDHTLKIEEEEATDEPITSSFNPNEQQGRETDGNANIVKLPIGSEELHELELQNADCDNNDSSTPINFEDLPSLLKNVCASFDDKDKEMMLLATLTVVSSTLPNVFGVYNQEVFYPNLYLYIVGKAGSGKGNIVWAKRLLKAIESTTIQELTGAPQNSLLPILANPDFKGVKIQIPANNTYAGFVRLLQLQNGTGLVFETEGDTLSNALKSEHGNFSDLLRKAYHHEPITQFRKTGDEFVDLRQPKLSVVISSTPNQMNKIISNSENGLFSRFMYYETEADDTFQDVFAQPVLSRGSVIEAEGNELKELYIRLRNEQKVCFSFTAEQMKKFLEFFQLNKSITIHLCHGELEATINRLGLISFRIAMILTVLRNSKSDNIENLICSDIDFELCKQLASKLLVSANKMFQSLPKQNSDELTEKQLYLFRKLPNEFKTIDIKVLGKKHGLAERSVDRFLKSKCFVKIGHGQYRKIE